MFDFKNICGKFENKTFNLFLFKISICKVDDRFQEMLSMKPCSRYDANVQISILK